MTNKNFKGFTLLELVIVTIIIGVLMMASTVYIGGNDETRKVIEAQGCAAKIGGEIRNFVFYALTSKNLRLSESEIISPNFYIVQFTGGDSDYCSTGHMCDRINLSYSTGDTPTNIRIYKTLDVSTCQTNKQPIKFYWTGGDISYIVMNKGFSPRNINNKEFFYLSGSNGIELLGDAIIGLCLNKDCTSPKEIGKFVADARSQTISTKNCKFYENNSNNCKTREDCRLYDQNDLTKCLEY